jgi:cobalt-zinc-cadmium efflux system outer membrane protein
MHVTSRISSLAARAVAIGTLAAPLHPVLSQLPVTRAAAERAALAAGPRVALARADTALARAAIITARALPNPSLAASHSGAPPQKHLIVDVPFDAPWTRGPRISAANAAGRSARLRFLSERAAALLEVDTTYTRALGAQARFRLSRQTARDADSLRKMTVARRNAGDASDLDVDLASVTAGQQENVAATDSLTYMSTVLTVQTLMGIPADSVKIVLVDTLRLGQVETERLLAATDSAVVLITPPSVTTSPITLPSATPTTVPPRTNPPANPPGAPPAAAPPAAAPPAGPTTNNPATFTPLQPAGLGTAPSVAAAEASLQAAELAIRRERRSVFGITSFQVGVEWGDPTVDPPDNEKLYIFGVTIPIPIFNQNQGAIAQATAERDRARAELTSIRLQVRQRIAESYRELASLRARVARDQELVVRAERVAAKSLTAYREGASALPAVLEARRTAREVLGQYIDDLTALVTLQSELRVLTQTVPPQ